jgi:hypothetical protein
VAIEELKKLQAEVQRRQAEVVAAREEVENNKPRGLRPQPPTQERRLELEAVLTEVVNIKI